MTSSILFKFSSDNDIKDQLAEFEKKILSQQDQQTKALLKCLTNIFPENNSQLDIIRSKIGKVSTNELPNVAKTTKNNGKDLKVLQNSKHKSDTGRTKPLSSLILKPIENTIDNVKVRRLHTLKKPVSNVKETVSSRKLNEDKTSLNLSKSDDRVIKQSQSNICFCFILKFSI